MEENNKKIKWKYLAYIFSGLISLFIVVYFINKLIVTEAPFKVAQDNDWIGFWGSVLGSILSGVITFIVLKITINNEDRKRKEDRKMLDEQRLEDKRMSVLPYLNYTIVDDKYIQENKIENELETPLWVSPKSENDGDVNIDCNFNLLIENLGLGIAIEPRLDKIYYDGMTNTLMARNKTILGVGNSAVMRFRVVYPNEGVEQMTLKIGYFNLIRDYYEQEVIVHFQGKMVFIKDKDRNISKGKIVYEPVILSIEKPQIIECYKDVNISVQISMS